MRLIKDNDEVRMYYDMICYKNNIVSPDYENDTDEEIIRKEEESPFYDLYIESIDFLNDILPGLYESIEKYVIDGKVYIPVLVFNSFNWEAYDDEEDEDYDEEGDDETNNFIIYLDNSELYILETNSVFLKFDLINLFKQHKFQLELID